MTMTLTRVCVFCGSSTGTSDAYADQARALANELVSRGIGLVFGGGSVGLMGVIADSVIAAGGEAIGVIPRSLVEREIGHHGVSDLRVVDTMHERKALMSALSDGFIALPGGVGTLEELFEAWTWGQLGIHAKPCGLLDAGGYYAALLTFIDHMVAEGFMRAENREMLLVNDTPAMLLDQMTSYRAPRVAKWMTAIEA
jgi:uncharacterized protein (TIGR00730 family)